jgi:hypothetical protein
MDALLRTTPSPRSFGSLVMPTRRRNPDGTANLHMPSITIDITDFADPDGGTYLAVDQPSTLFANYGNPDIADVGTYLDVLLAGLLTAVHAPVPGELITH